MGCSTEEGQYETIGKTYHYEWADKKKKCQQERS